MNNQELQVLKSLVNSEKYNNISLLLSKLKSPNDYQIVKNWIEKCNEANIELSENELILMAINQELETHGIESIFDDDGNKLFSYCNNNDEFSITIMYYYPKEKFILTSFINIIEAINNNILEIFIND